VAVGDAGNRGTEVYYASAVQRVLEAVRDYLIKEEGLMGVYVAPDPAEIDPATGADKRAADQRALTILVTTAVVGEVRTVGSGERVSEGGEVEPDFRIDHPVHRRILRNSPLQPWDGDPAKPRTDLLRKDVLDEYLFFKSRHPGRRVDASVAPGEEPGTVVLDYMVTENRPLTLYAQFSNTGTETTGEWRTRLGFFHTQLTDHDDIVAVDYITSGFDEMHLGTASYERPFENERWRWRVEGGWSQYSAEDIGFFEDDFEGETWWIGGEVAWNFYQKRELFLDLAAGLRYEDISVDNNTLEIHGGEGFLIPYVQMRLERTTEWFSTLGMAGFEFGFTNADEDDLEALGRTDPDEEWVVLQGALAHSVYLEPLLDREGWENPLGEDQPTLAHEVAMAVRGQWAMGNRLIPQAEQVVGGLYTVRGYPEAATAGDSVVVASAEYRFHLPKSFGVEREPGEFFGRTFRYAPQYVYGTPDWDLIFKGFVDAGWTWNSDRRSFESDDTLAGAGIGVEFLYRRNVNIRLDWGFALKDLESADVEAGDSRVHFVATILY